MWVAGAILASSFSSERDDVIGPHLQHLQEMLEHHFSVWQLDLRQASLREPLPSELHDHLEKMDAVYELREMLVLPTYIEAAGGYSAANAFASAGVERNGGDSVAFVKEVSAALNAALSMWGYEAALSWMRSSNSSSAVPARFRPSHLKAPKWCSIP